MRIEIYATPEGNLATPLRISIAIQSAGIATAEIGVAICKTVATPISAFATYGL